MLFVGCGSRTPERRQEVKGSWERGLQFPMLQLHRSRCQGRARRIDPAGSTGHSAVLWRPRSCCAQSALPQPPFFPFSQGRASVPLLLQHLQL